METLAEQIARLSGGHVTFDARRRALRQLVPSRGWRDCPMTEVELRRRLQRLLLTSDRRPTGAQDSQQLAIELLLEKLEADSAA